MYLIKRAQGRLVWWLSRRAPTKDFARWDGPGWYFDRLYATPMPAEEATAFILNACDQSWGRGFVYSAVPVEPGDPCR